MRRVLLVLTFIACGQVEQGASSPVAQGGAGGARPVGGSAGRGGGDAGAGGELEGGAGDAQGSGYAGGTPRPGQGGTDAQAGQGGSGEDLASEGGAGGAEGGWLALCDSGQWCPEDYPTCATVSVAEGEPSEKRCTFLCEGAGDEAQCSGLGGQCRSDCGGCLLACGPSL
jgi:hypothetical protein